MLFMTRIIIIVKRDILAIPNPWSLLRCVGENKALDGLAERQEFVVRHYAVTHERPTGRVDHMQGGEMPKDRPGLIQHAKSFDEYPGKA